MAEFALPAHVDIDAAEQIKQAVAQALEAGKSLTLDAEDGDTEINSTDSTGPEASTAGGPSTEVASGGPPDGVADLPRSLEGAGLDEAGTDAPRASDAGSAGARPRSPRPRRRGR